MRDSFLYALLTEVAKILAILTLFMAIKVLKPAEDSDAGRTSSVPQVERVEVRSL